MLYDTYVPEKGFWGYILLLWKEKAGNIFVLRIKVKNILG